jgi:putative redox protein
MGQAKVRWAGSHTFIGTDSTCHAVLMSNKEDNVGMKASELMLVSLACCSSFDVVDIMEKRKVVLHKLEVEVKAEQEKDPPWTYTDIHLIYTMAGEGLTPKYAETAIKLSEEKYCSVAATLKGKANITWEYVIEE